LINNFDKKEAEIGGINVKYLKNHTKPLPNGLNEHFFEVDNVLDLFSIYFNK